MSDLEAHQSDSARSSSSFGSGAARVGARLVDAPGGRVELGGLAPRRADVAAVAQTQHAGENAFLAQHAGLRPRIRLVEQRERQLELVGLARAFGATHQLEHLSEAGLPGAVSRAR